MLAADSTDGLTTVLIAFASVAAVVISVMVWRSQRKASTDANTLAGEANRIAQKQSDLEVMEATIENLRQDLAAAKSETAALRTDLAAARSETRKLEAQATTALANCSIMNDFIREHVPDVPFPRLRRVPDVG
jgi:septal ring factor EnvC (AmiA/AmiB activator)